MASTCQGRPLPGNGDPGQKVGTAREALGEACRQSRTAQRCGAACGEPGSQTAAAVLISGDRGRGHPQCPSASAASCPVPGAWEESLVDQVSVECQPLFSCHCSWDLVPHFKAEGAYLAKTRHAATTSWGLEGSRGGLRNLEATLPCSPLPQAWHTGLSAPGAGTVCSPVPSGWVGSR